MTSRIAPSALPICVVIAAAGAVLLVVGPEQPAQADVFAGIGGAYGAGRTLEMLATRLRRQIELESTRGEVLAAVHDTLHPAHATLWLRLPDPVTNPERPPGTTEVS